MKRCVLGLMASVLFLGVVAGQTRADLITYDIQSYPQSDPLDQNGYTVTGTITINAAYLGTISDLGLVYSGTPSPIVSWSYSIYDPTGTLVNSSSSADPGSYIYQDGSGSILATSTTLTTYGGDPALMLYEAGSWLEWFGGGGSVRFGGELPGETIWNYVEPLLPDGSVLIGVVPAASVPSPEPSGLTLLGIGIACIGGYAWRRRYKGDMLHN